MTKKEKYAAFMLVMSWHQMSWETKQYMERYEHNINPYPANVKNKVSS